MMQADLDTSCCFGGISSDNVVFSTEFHHQMTVVMHACEKIATSLPSLVAEEHGQESQNERRLSWAKTDHRVAVARRRPDVIYSCSVSCNLC